MTFKPAADWISGFPEDDEDPHRRLPPARKRTPALPPDEAPAPQPETANPPPADLGAVSPDQDFFDAQEEEEEAARDPKPSGASARKATYEIGYKRPPVAHQFKPGQSGNPKGRPRGAKGLNTLVRETLGSELSVRTADGTKKISKIEAVLQKTLEKALKGDSRAQLELMKLWRAAVPDIPEADEAIGNSENLTQGDLAILAAFKKQLAERTGDGL